MVGVIGYPDSHCIDHRITACELPGATTPCGYVSQSKTSDQGRASATKIAVHDQVSRLCNLGAGRLKRQVAHRIARRFGDGVVLEHGPAKLSGDEHQQQ